MGGRSFRRSSKVVWPGFTNAPLPRHIAKVGRNDLCPCGSGEKYKSCHEKDGSEFLEKLQRRADKEHLAEVRQQMKASGVPWYRRLFIRL